MSKELITALNALEKENGISKEVMFDAIEKSLMDEYKAEFDKADNGRVSLDRIQLKTAKLFLTELQVISISMPTEQLLIQLHRRKRWKKTAARKKLKSLYMARKFHMQMLRRLSLTARLVMY